MEVLYISYDGALDSLGQSQIVPYLKGLTDRGLIFILLTFEKNVDLKDDSKIKLLREELSDSKIKWRYLMINENSLCSWHRDSQFERNSLQFSKYF